MPSNVIPYKKWLLAKQRRRALGSWDRDMSNGTDCMDLADVVHSPQFKARFAELIGMGVESNPVQEAPIRGRAVSCDVYIDDSNGPKPKGED
jgi:hypothetical protein